MKDREPLLIRGGPPMPNNQPQPWEEEARKLTLHGEEAPKIMEEPCTKTDEATSQTH